MLIEFGIPKKLARLVKMCSTETYSKVQVGKNLSDTFPIRNGLKQKDAPSPLLFMFPLVYTIRRVQVNQDGLKLNGKHQLLVYAEDANTLEGNVHTIKKNAEALVVASKETGLEVKADKSKYKAMSRDQKAGRSHSIKNDNNSFEKVEEFKYLGTILTSQNSIQEGNKSRLKSGNACYYSVQNLLSSNLLSKIIEIKIYITVILPFF